MPVLWLLGPFKKIASQTPESLHSTTFFVIWGFKLAFEDDINELFWSSRLWDGKKLYI